MEGVDKARVALGNTVGLGDMRHFDHVKSHPFPVVYIAVFPKVLVQYGRKMGKNVAGHHRQFGGIGRIPQ